MWNVKITELKRYLALLEYKLAFYQKAKALGSVEAVKFATDSWNSLKGNKWANHGITRNFERDICKI